MQEPKEFRGHDAAKSIRLCGGKEVKLCCLLLKTKATILLVW
jgi:hypothetical protein